MPPAKQARTSGWRVSTRHELSNRDFPQGEGPTAFPIYLSPSIIWCSQIDLIKTKQPRHDFGAVWFLSQTRYPVLHYLAYQCRIILDNCRRTRAVNICFAALGAFGHTPVRSASMRLRVLLGHFFVAINATMTVRTHTASFAFIFVHNEQ